MGLLKKLFGGGPEERRGEIRHAQSIEFDNCTELIAAVGEASYQPALRDICGSTRWERVRFDCAAALVAEPSNPYDANAVAVYADCRGTYLHVGYLSRGDALDYQAAVWKAADMGYTIICQAHVAGREQGSETPNLGIFLDLPTPEGAVAELGALAAESISPLAPTPEASAASPARGRLLDDDSVNWSRFDDCRRVSVVGYDFHQPGLRAVTGGQMRPDLRFECRARLVREPDNEHDENAVKVMVGDQKIGYVKAGSAKRMQKRLRVIAEAGTAEDYTCLIRIRDPSGTLQAHLQVPYSSELLKGYKKPKTRQQSG
jgi:HIRAN domain-containing protein